MPASYTRVAGVLMVIGVVLLGISPADAALTTDKCLVKKRQAWSALRKCQAAADVKRLRGKPADLGKCQTLFEQKLAKIDGQAAKAVDRRF